MIFRLMLFDFIWKLHESYYKQLYCKWYATKVQYLINVDALPSPELNPLEGPTMCSCGKVGLEGAPDFEH
jgi:hypothetical protein